MTEQPHPNRVRLLPWPVPDRLVDAALIVLLLAPLIGLLVADPDLDRALHIGAGLVGVALVLVRRIQPIAVLAAAVVGGTVVSAVSGRPNVLLPAALMVLYLVATMVPWRLALALGAVTVAAFAGTVLVFLEPGRLEGGLLAAIAWPAFATATGSAVRQARESLADARDRASRAEATRELEASRRVVEERLRIARDVHDLVAHHLAVVNVQSGVAAHVLRHDPDAATAALDAVRTAASTAVAELGELLGVLRDRGDGTGGGRVDPTPDLGAIDDLIASFSASGLAVEHRVTGVPRALASTVQVAAYRIVQEALTNAHKHGDGSVVLTQTWTDDALTITADNRVPAVAVGAEPSGFGLIGMGERVDAVGGELTVSEGDGWYRVTAVLPAVPSTGPTNPEVR